MSRNVVAHLRAARTPAPNPRDPGTGEAVVVASAQDALAAAARVAETEGLAAIRLGDAIQGEARALARCDAGLIRRVTERGGPVSPPCVILSGGEATVTVRGGGRGGPNGEYVLALAEALRGLPKVYALACDTDGLDGTGDNAGALATPDTLSRAAARGIDVAKALRENDSYGFFSSLEDLVVTGPTRTNVSDFRAALIDSPGP